VGCGLIGERRAFEAKANGASICAAVTDVNLQAAQRVAAVADARVAPNWQAIVADPEIDIVCISTPNGFLAEVAIAALGAGKHVLLEKPMGRNAVEARAIAEAGKRAGRFVKIGFNHRYHPAIRRAHEELTRGTIGKPINARCRYGHGARPGYENEWRGNRELAGGGEMLDQGVHVVDLLHWFLGRPNRVFGVTQSAVWPLGDLEDNGFATLWLAADVLAQIHTSWTQWKNLFSFEIFGKGGALIVGGLGRSYGQESLTIVRRKMEGGVPEVERILYEDVDHSWRDEWGDFLAAIEIGTSYWGTPVDGVVAMNTIEALYRSARDEVVVYVAHD
jgi:predicted dehydrogenase